MRLRTARSRSEEPQSRQRQGGVSGIPGTPLSRTRVIGLHTGSGRLPGTEESHDAGEESRSAAVVPHLSTPLRGRGRCHGGAEQAGSRGGAGQGQALRRVQLGSLAGRPGARRGPDGPGRCLG